MRASDELMEKIKTAIEKTPYGSVSITLSEKGDYVDVITEKKERVPKKDYHRG